MDYSHTESMINLPAHANRHALQGFSLLAKLTDMGLIAGLLVTTVTLHEMVWHPGYSVAAALSGMLFVTFGEFAGVYRPWRGETSKRQFFQILGVWLQVAALLLLLAYLFKSTANFSRVATGAWLLLVPILLSGWRAVTRTLSERIGTHVGHPRQILLWGSGDVAERLKRTIQHSPWLGLNLHTQVDYPDATGSAPASPPGPAACAAATKPLAVSGIETLEAQLQRIEALVRDGEIEIVYIALPSGGQARDHANLLIERLADSAASVFLVPDFFTSDLAHGTWSHLHGIPLLSVYDTPFWGVDGWLKRTEDIVISSLILLIIALPMLAIALAVKLSSPGPVLFKQRRYGINSRQIRVWKFRSMTVCDDGDRFTQAKRQDPRITPLGAFLRRTSLDELPQFINVLLGDMSIVGPRPHPVAMNEHYRGRIRGYVLRHRVRPGITGWAQVNGWRGETDTHEKIAKRIEHDIWYIRNWSLWLDLRIIMMTFSSGFLGRNAY